MSKYWSLKPPITVDRILDEECRNAHVISYDAGWTSHMPLQTPVGNHSHHGCWRPNASRQPEKKQLDDLAELYFSTSPNHDSSDVTTWGHDQIVIQYTSYDILIFDYILKPHQLSLTSIVSIYYQWFSTHCTLIISYYIISSHCQLDLPTFLEPWLRTPNSDWSTGTLAPNFPTTVAASPCASSTRKGTSPFPPSDPWRSDRNARNQGPVLYNTNDFLTENGEFPTKRNSGTSICVFFGGTTRVKDECL